MTDPRLLRAGTPHAFDRSLLESAQDDRAPEGAEARALAALGIGAVATGAALVASHVTGAPPAAATASKVATAVVLKWVAVGVVVSAVPLAYVAGTRKERPPEASTPAARSSTPSATVSSIANVEAPVPAVEPSAVASVEPPAPSASARSSPPVAAPSARATPVRTADTLSAELDLLDRTRAALSGHDAAEARRLLDEYESRYPRGMLREEAELASIETLVAGGRTADANQAALHFIADHPNSTLLGRVRAIARRTANP